ncbi:hypothetical protein PVAP13_6NG263500 [Panicum virgatum]|uniref:F-box domain-containing protein n=1 Tax=Panicum virgatum TaxID=38727 RepID=A0A8T0R214_PANVG|nr:hypothetical protein PVAP13_6NG263500 [Panicum virgatum]
MATASASGREATAAAVDECWNLPTDAFVEILLRLPPIRRRWARLVCRRWRDVIDERTPRGQRPKVLVCFTTATSASATVVDDLAHGWGREVWRIAAGRGTGRRVDTVVVGTCNVLLCGSASATTTSPAGGSRWPAAARLVPRDARLRQLEGVQLRVFTLGEASWRDVAVPGASCCPDAGLVSAGGAAYWATGGAEGVVSFDLEDERVAFAAPLPVGAGPGSGSVFRLIEFHGRLGLAVCADRPTPARTEVWVLGDGMDPRGWSRRYSVQGVERRLAAPHFAHGGEYVLTVASKGWEQKHVYAHRMRGAGVLRRGEVRSVRIGEPGTAAACFKNGSYLRTFAYEETTEPLSVYKILPPFTFDRYILKTQMFTNDSYIC